MNWRQCVLIAGGSVAAAALLYYLLREETAELTETSNKKHRKIDVHSATKEQVLQILKEILKAQEKMKDVMKGLTEEINSKKLNFQKTYERVKDVQPDDPLDSYGISMTDFDVLLDKYQRDPIIRDTIVLIMGAPNPANMSAKVHTITKSTIVDVHTFMLSELKRLVNDFSKLTNKGEFDMKVVTIAAQAFVGAKVHQKFSLSSDDIESAVLIHHQALTTDSEFACVNMQIQSAMNHLMGLQYPI